MDLTALIAATLGLATLIAALVTWCTSSRPPCTPPHDHAPTPEDTTPDSIESQQHDLDTHGDDLEACVHDPAPCENDLEVEAVTDDVVHQENPVAPEDQIETEKDDLEIDPQGHERDQSDLEKDEKPEQEIDHYDLEKDQTDFEKDQAVLESDQPDVESDQHDLVSEQHDLETDQQDQTQSEAVEVANNASALSAAKQSQDSGGSWMGNDKAADSDGEADPRVVRSDADDTQTSFVDTLSDYQPPRRVTKEDRKESGRTTNVVIMPPTNKTAASQFAGNAAENMCKVCGKRVYEMEKMLADKAVYHKTCFKCIHCKRVLSLGNFASLDGNMYCKPHFIELFKAKGNYDEGFGKERRAKQWAPAVEATPVKKEPASVAPAEDTEAADIIRADEKPEDDRENLPSIRNLKSRFENQENGGSTENLSKGGRKFGSGGDVNSGGEKDTRQRQQYKWQVKEARHLAWPGSPTTGDAEPINYDDLVRADDQADPDDNKPASATTKSLLSRFQADGNAPPPTPEESNKKQKAAVKSLKQSHDAPATTAPRMTEQELEEREAYNGQADAGEFENEPLRQEDVIRETDSLDGEELPGQGTTRNLLAKFQSMQST